MNPDELVAQQQAYLNQAMQHAQLTQWAALAVSIAGMVIGFLVLYMFYARLRDIADELRKMRIAYEMFEDRKAYGGGNAGKPPGSTPGENPFADHGRYQPKQ